MRNDELVSVLLRQCYLVRLAENVVTGIAWPVNRTLLITAASSVGGNSSGRVRLDSADNAILQAEVVETNLGLNYALLAIHPPQNLNAIRLWKAKRFHGHYCFGCLASENPSLADIDDYEVTEQQLDFLINLIGTNRSLLPGTPIINADLKATVGMFAPRFSGDERSSVLAWETIARTSGYLKNYRPPADQAITPIEEISIPQSAEESSPSPAPGIQEPSESIDFDFDVDEGFYPDVGVASDGDDSVLGSSSYDRPSSYALESYSPELPPSPTAAGPEVHDEGGETVHSDTPFHHPFASFHRVSPDKDEEISIDEPLSTPPQNTSIEFCFGFSAKLIGIPQRRQTILTPPKEIPYPFTVHIEVWSSDLFFETSNASLTLKSDYQEVSARFRLRNPPFAAIREKADVFVFIRHGTHLIGVFHIGVGLADSVTVEVGAIKQHMDCAYLDNQWFRFVKGELSAPALTIYVREQGSQLAIFAFGDQRPVWARMGIDTDKIYSLTRQIYLTITELAVSLEKNRSTGFRSARYRFSQHGANLFSDLFFSQADNALSDFGEFIATLPDGTEINIALDLQGRGLVIPWGFIYDRTPPEGEFSGVVENSAFWGNRFKLTIRPNYESGVEMASPSSTLIAGHVYERPEAEALAEIIGNELKQKGISQFEEIAIADSWLPSLETRPYGLIHFNCHGYIQISDTELLNALAGATGGDLQYIRDPAKGSFLFTKNGTATLATLQRKLRRLPSAPLILLTMCHSAQVSSAGGSFVTLFLGRGACAVVGTEGPNPFDLARCMDASIVKKLLQGVQLSTAVWESRKQFLDANPLALIYTVYGNGQATLPRPVSLRGEQPGESHVPRERNGQAITQICSDE